VTFTDFILQDPGDTEEWLEEAYSRFSPEDLNFLATMAWNISHMENFIFSSEFRSKDFFEFMEKENHYLSSIH
jgi:hypothetical protein|tara:strand:+ start:258 stop:476 length:219 start_codon:yes stop_codon:yes gene_type:complete